MILLLDNYDSFTYNLAQYLGQMGQTLVVRRNDKISLDEIADLRPERIVISPGPGTPAPGRHFHCADRAICREDSDPRRLPRPSSHRRSLWRPGDSRGEVDARQDQPDPS